MGSIASVYPSDAVDVRFPFELGLTAGFVQDLPFQLAAGGIDIVATGPSDHS
jgi:hypothetical protein